MVLRLQLNRSDLADRIDEAVAQALEDGYRTRDLIGGSRVVGTKEMGTAIRERLSDGPHHSIASSPI
jgi:3-isopropylmalate dehydrogenase